MMRKRYWLAALPCMLVFFAFGSDEGGGVFSWRSLFGMGTQARPQAALVDSVAVSLVPHPAKAPHLDALPESAFGRCTPRRLAPVDFEELEQTLGLPPVPDYFELTGLPGQPPLALVDQKVRGLSTWGLWEVKPGDKPVLLHQRPLVLAANQSEWIAPSLLDVVCLPESRVLVGMDYDLMASMGGPKPHSDIFLVEPATGKSQRVVERAVPGAYGDPRSPGLVRTRIIAPKAVVVLYHTELIRLAPEVYSSQWDHLLLFTAKRPGGVEIAQVSREQGKIRDWGMSGRTLWLTTRTDTPRQAEQERYWSLDLDPLLQ